MVVERCAFGKEVVGADDRGVAAGITAADPALLEHRDVGQPMLARQVIGGAEAMTTAPDDERVIGWFGVGMTPLGLPAALASETASQQRQAGKALHHRILQVPRPVPASARASRGHEMSVRALFSALRHATCTRTPGGLNECDIACDIQAAARLDTRAGAPRAPRESRATRGRARQISACSESTSAASVCDA